MRFSDSFLDEIRSRVPISSVVGRFVQWDRRKTNAGRGDYWACCPFHAEKTPSFHAEDGKGRYHCFGCRASGDAFRFLVEKEGLSFPEAVERLAGEAGLEMPRASVADDAREAERTSLYDVMELAARFFEDRLNSGEAGDARGYLKARGVGAGMQSAFRLGYAPAGRNVLKQHLAENGIGGDLIARSGLVVAGEDIAVPYDRFRDRIMFPIRDRRGRVIAFGGRALSSDAPAKYLNSPDTPLFHKRSVLYNLDQARRAAHDAGSVVAVEGYMDVIALARAGLAQAVAPLGTALTEDHLATLWRLAPEPVLCFDGDTAGLKAAYRSLDLALPLLKPGHSLRFAVLPQGQDPDDVLAEQGADALQALIGSAEPLIAVLWRRALEENDRRTPEKRAEFEVTVDEAVSRIADPRVRTHYRSDLSERLRALWHRGQAGRPRFKRAPQFRKDRFTLMRPWETPVPASAELKSISRAVGLRQAGERRERLLLLAAINQPRLLEDEMELLAEADFASAALDRLRRQILDIAALSPGLDSSAMRDHLSRDGCAGLLAQLDRQGERLGAWFIRSDAAFEDARIGFRQMIALHDKATRLESELRAAERALAEEPSEEALDRLNAVREQLRSSIGEEARIEGFGEASGRPSERVG